MMANAPQLDRRVARTRNQIEAAFLDLLQESNLQSITIQQIARRAMINRATFYDHFEDKYALFDHLIHQTFQQTLAAHGLESCAYSPENLHRLIKATAGYFLYLNEQCPPGEQTFRPIVEGQVQRLLFDYLCAWWGRDPAGEMQAAFLSWAIFGVCRQQFSGGSANGGLAPDVSRVTGELYALAQGFLGGTGDPVLELTRPKLPGRNGK